MKISIGSDHRGYELKSKIIAQFPEHAWTDVGTNSSVRTDYPIYAQRVCRNILEGKSELGILLCGSGVGVSIAANRFKKIYAALCWNEQIAARARQHDGANVLVIPAEFVSDQQAYAMISAWLSAQFKGDVYQQRLDMMDE
jgi:ribose 5-phosphate isomerase B